MRIALPTTTRTRLTCVLLIHTVNEDTVFLGFIFKQVREAVELPSVELLVPTLAPVTRVTVLVLSNLAQLADGDASDLVVDALLNGVFGECVQEVFFPTRQLLAGTEGTA